MLSFLRWGSGECAASGLAFVAVLSLEHCPVFLREKHGGIMNATVSHFIL